MRPQQGDYVEIVANSTLKVIDSGKLVKYTPEIIVIDRNPFSKYPKMLRQFDARVHHFHGYMPPRLLVWKDEIEKSD